MLLTLITLITMHYLKTVMKHDYFMVWHESHLVNLQHSPIEWRLHKMNFKDCIFIFGQDIGNNSNTV